MIEQGKMVFWEREVAGMSVSQITRNAIFALALIVLGIIIGKLTEYILKKLIKEARLEKTRGYSFFQLVVSVIKWAIYIIFVNLALNQLGIPQFTNWLINILIVIPALVGALLLIVVGFAIASYLKELIEESRIAGWGVLSTIFYYFIIYVFLAFAFKTALISLDKTIVNWLLIILTGIVAAGVVFWQVKNR
ncbi:hypothetical protein FJZ19_03845 [Candidatus Pacearchaeota archaeon]|nr:hypothetical protein [Candidatus Pacearchaeota archaeon]